MLHRDLVEAVYQYETSTKLTPPAHHEVVLKVKEFEQSVMKKNPQLYEKKMTARLTEIRRMNSEVRTTVFDKVQAKDEIERIRKLVKFISIFHIEPKLLKDYQQCYDGLKKAIIQQNETNKLKYYIYMRHLPITKMIGEFYPQHTVDELVTAYDQSLKQEERLKARIVIDLAELILPTPIHYPLKLEMKDYLRYSIIDGVYDKVINCCKDQLQLSISEALERMNDFPLLLWENCYNETPYKERLDKKLKLHISEEIGN
jgi:hypothetical protein